MDQQIAELRAQRKDINKQIKELKGPGWCRRAAIRIVHKFYERLAGLKGAPITVDPIVEDKVITQVEGLMDRLDEAVDRFAESKC